MYTNVHRYSLKKKTILLYLFSKRNRLFIVYLDHFPPSWELGIQVIKKKIKLFRNILPSHSTPPPSHPLSLSAVGLDPFPSSLCSFSRTFLPIFPCNRTYLVILYCILFLFCLLNIIFVCIYLYIFSTFSHYLDLSNVLFPLFSLTYLSPPPFLSPPPPIKMHVFCPNLFYLYVQYV